MVEVVRVVKRHLARVAVPPEAADRRRLRRLRRRRHGGGCLVLVAVAGRQADAQHVRARGGARRLLDRRQPLLANFVDAARRRLLPPLLVLRVDPLLQPLQLAEHRAVARLLLEELDDVLFAVPLVEHRPAEERKAGRAQFAHIVGVAVEVGRLQTAKHVGAGGQLGVGDVGRHRNVDTAELARVARPA